MKVDLYATEHEQGWRLNVSLDMRVDSLWWTATTKRNDSCQSLWHITSALSVGWAFACMRHFNGRLQHQRKAASFHTSLQHRSNIGTVRTEETTVARASIIIEQIRQWLSEYITSRQSLSSNSPHQSNPLKANVWDQFSYSTSVHSSGTMAQLVFPCQLWTREGGWTGSGQYVLAHSAKGQLQGDLQQTEYKKQLACGAIALTGLLNGRSLLLPELHHLMDDKKSPYASIWRSCVQLAYLQKHIRLLDSVYASEEASTEKQHMDSRRAFFQTFQHGIGISSSHPATCRRCGSTSIRYTACAGCGSSACGYCEECLMMGRSRECGLLLQSVRPPIARRIAEQLEPDTVAKQPDSFYSSASTSSLFAVSSVTAQQGSTAPTEQQRSKAGIECREGIQARWRLSNAQTAATLQALAFLQSNRDVSSQQPEQSFIGRLSKAFWYKCKTTLLEKRGYLQPESDQSLKSKPANSEPLSELLNEENTMSNLHTQSPAHIQNRQDAGKSVITNGLIQMSQLPRSRRFLLWAVTGAGKTEMVFPLIEYMLQLKQSVLIATPRRDVVLELAPRLRQAFPGEQVVALYGGSEEQWIQGAITIATTHQLLRYHAAFDLVIIDEIDAFPYEGNPMLAYGAYTACRPEGKFVYLSATPSDELRRAIRQGRLAHAKVPVRFHGHPLPVPRRIKLSSFVSWYGSGKLPNELLQQAQHSIDRGAQLFWFMPRIAWVEPMVILLKQHFPMLHIAGTSSEDEQRAQKVLQFRERQIRILVTTTILERGVTVPGSDVYIIDAHDHVYHASALIQMAGRAGRSKQDPAGKVIFTASQYGRSQRQAIGQIRLMNRIARKQNYIVSSNGRK